MSNCVIAEASVVAQCAAVSLAQLAVEFLLQRECCAQALTDPLEDYLCAPQPLVADLRRAIV